MTLAIVWTFTRRLIGALIRWFPLTPLGALVLPLLLAVLRGYGIGRSDKIVLALSLGGLVLVALAVLQVLLTVLWLRVRPQRRPDETRELEVGVACRSGELLGLVAWNPLVRVETSWLTPNATAVWVYERGRWHEEVTPRERGECALIVRRLVISDVFGLARITIDRRWKQPVRVQPHAGKIGRLPFLAQPVPGDSQSQPNGKPRGDLLEMRRYQPGDPLKLVLWKVYARSGQLLVRAPEMAESPSEKKLAYLIAGTDDEATAGVARALLENGSLGDAFVFGATGTADARTLPEALLSVRQSAARRGEEEGLAAFWARGEAMGLNECVLFVPCRPGSWLERVCAEVQRRPGRCRVLIGCDGIPLVQRRRWQTLLMRTEEISGPTHEQLATVSERLRRTGAEVWLVDRTTGEVHHNNLSPALSASCR